MESTQVGHEVWSGFKWLCLRNRPEKMSDVLTFSSYCFCLFPDGLGRTQELINAKLKTGTEDKKRN